MREPRPYFDDDFEVFIDASQSNYFYVEFEMNARSQTPQTLGVSFFFEGSQLLKLSCIWDPGCVKAQGLENNSSTALLCSEVVLK